MCLVGSVELLVARHVGIVDEGTAVAYQPFLDLGLRQFGFAP